VRFHLKSLRRKLALRSRAELRAFPGRPASAIEQARAARAARRIREEISLVHVRRMDRALDFYSAALGFAVVARWPDEGDAPAWVALAAGGARLMLRVGHPRRSVVHPAKPGPVTLNLYVEGLDAVRRDLVAAGYRCGEPQSLFYGAREFYVLDPDGNELALVEFAAGDPGYMATAETPRPSAQTTRRRRKR
jgi:uncharacterized glyoxalase superfamily protein PhnB